MPRRDRLVTTASGLLALLLAHAGPILAAQQQLYHRWDHASSAYGYWALTLSKTGELAFEMSYMKQPASLALQLTPGEMAYLTSLTNPMSRLVGQPISGMATGVGDSVLRLNDGAKEVELRWVHSDQPDLLAFTRFVQRLANRERCRILLASNKPEVVYDGTHEVVWNLAKIFRASGLRGELWSAVESWPIAGLSRLHNRSVLADTVMALAVLETKEERSGRLMATLSRLPVDNQVLAAITLSPYVVDRYLPSELPPIPWPELTPSFIEQLAAAKATPEAERDWLRRNALVELPPALRALKDPRVTAALAAEGKRE